MKLERFIVLTYGFTVCFASIVLFVGTLVFVIIKIDTMQQRALELPAISLASLAATPAESRKVYLDDRGNPIAPPSGFDLDATSAGKPVPVASFRQGVSDFEARLELLRRGEELGAKNAEEEFRHRLGWSQLAVQIALLITSLALFVFHWRWLQKQLGSMSSTAAVAGVLLSVIGFYYVGIPFAIIGAIVIVGKAITR